jgi:hypothetical protein
MTTLCQLSKISVDNYVQQPGQTLGQLISTWILLVPELEKRFKFL